MSLYIPKMSDTPGVTIPGLAGNFDLLEGSRIVEQGSNENGEYVRWADGLQICYVKFRIDQRYNAFFHVKDVVLPAGFEASSGNVVILTRESATVSSSKYLRMREYGDVSGDGKSLRTRLHDPEGELVAGEGINCQAIVIGRWK